MKPDLPNLFLPTLSVCLSLPFYRQVLSSVRHTISIQGRAWKRSEFNAHEIPLTFSRKKDYFKKPLLVKELSEQKTAGIKGTKTQTSSSADSLVVGLQYHLMDISTYTEMKENGCIVTYFNRGSRQK
jgi:hypothetical protein